MKRIILTALILLLIAAFSSCGADSSNGDDDDADFGQDADDDDVDPKDDDDADDDDALSCGLVWAECDYQYPFDNWPDECVGLSIEDTIGGHWYEVHAEALICIFQHEGDRYESLTDCGYEAGCDDDWKYAQYTCWANYYDVIYDCAETASGMEGLSAEQYYETCFDNADGIKDECEDI